MAEYSKLARDNARMADEAKVAEMLNLPSNATSANRLERIREIETMLNEYMMGDAQGVLSAVDKANEARLVAELTELERYVASPSIEAAIAAEKATYPIMNQAQRAAVEADKAIIQSEMKMAILNGDEVALAALQEKFLALPGEMAEYSKLARDNARMADEGMITGTTKLDDAVKAETLALSTEAGEAYSLARTAASDMYPAVAQTGMVTKAADLARIPNIARPWKAAEIADKAAIPYQAIARTVKASEMADKFKEPAIDIPTLPDKGIYLTPDKPKSEFVYKPHLRPEEKERQTMEVAPPTRPGWIQGNTREGNDGNWWSADFDDEHWNTPAGVQEAIGVWGRPIGNRIGNKVNWEW
jgi:hypothetical protein